MYGPQICSDSRYIDVHVYLDEACSSMSQEVVSS